MNINLKKILRSTVCSALCVAPCLLPVKADESTQNMVAKIDVTIPSLDVNPYHKPYVAVWLETLDRQYVTTIRLLADDQEWYKDLRQWWRKVGRANINVDGVTGATKRPGKVTLRWNGTDEKHQKIPNGEYYLNVEFSREEGGRDFARKKITLGPNNTFSIAGKTEFGDIHIHMFEQKTQ
jgi:hypothetical protein